MATSDKGNKQGGDTSKRGFASMDPQQQREIAAEGGRAAHEKGTAHEFTSEEARRAGSMSHKNDPGRSSQSASSGSSSGSSSGGGKGGTKGGNKGGANEAQDEDENDDDSGGRSSGSRSSGSRSSKP
ncbi:Stress-induced acidophilic repeat motif-containing protein [Duganella sp. CF402]|uniref:KGG domain-containing protein n=1 Tax=unclassified Duganella TaxID=2636909 RepID=UPI0008D24E71|nr:MULTISPECIES: KGG domain-containing protein [unclassified Duganella]RZT09179.1 stress-induced acidophilic repeat protein [Duganella sp. BK701]SEL67522.1 Stress-induced acidophilic repeat motif-containing protein [Duganella sp. CF402]